MQRLGRPWLHSAGQNPTLILRDAHVLADEVSRVMPGAAMAATAPARTLPRP